MAQIAPECAASFTFGPECAASFTLGEDTQKAS
jgi:hypothetical protein